VEPGRSDYVEVTGFGFEYGEVAVEALGRVTARTGASPHGQGHETAFAQLVANTLGVEADTVTVVHTDTAAMPRGVGPRPPAQPCWRPTSTVAGRRADSSCCIAKVAASSFECISSFCRMFCTWVRTVCGLM
jgi:CO/xanthine dehydrogenase Mo-binding subunit